MTDSRTAAEWASLFHNIEPDVQAEELRIIERILAQGRREGEVAGVAMCADALQETVDALRKEIQQEKETDNDTD